MPNWVNNTLTGPTEVLKQLLKSSGQLDFNIHAPMPMELRAYRAGSLVTEEQQAKAIEKDNLKLDNLNHEIPMTEADQKRFSETYGATDWYDWAVKNWGTKWSPDLDQEFEDGDEELIFQTAWAPPLAWLDKVSEQFPNAKFNLFWEEEQGFGQIVNIRNCNWETIEEWDMAEFGDWVTYGDYYIYPCTQSGGRHDEGGPLFIAGKFYIDMDASQQYDSMEDVEWAINKWHKQADAGNEEAKISAFPS